MALTKRFCETVKTPGRYADTRREGLYLTVKPSGAKSWGQRIVVRGRRRELGLGRYAHVSLAEAREVAFANHKAARQGGDPVADRARARAVPTLGEAVERVISLHSPSWRAKGAAATFRNTINRYCPALVDTPVDAITSADLLMVLVPVWSTKRKTAAHLRGYLTTVMGWTIAAGHRADDPMPAARSALPKRARAVAHRRTVGHAELGAALATIRAQDAWPCAKLAIEFCALTAARSGETRGAVWAEIDMDAATWTVPSSRMKMARDHRVPLSDRALDVLRAARQYGDGEGLCFPSSRDKKMAANSLTRLIATAGLADSMTVHGMRSAFRDWCADENKERDLAEASLAHRVPGVEGAYLRSDVLDRRRALMQDWGAFISTC